jgi:hypothetical protein
MAIYSKLNPLSQSRSRASYPQGPADPYALSDLLATPSPAQSRHFSSDGNFFSMRSDDPFDTERLAPPYIGNSQSSSTIDIGNYPSQDNDKRASGYSGSNIVTFTNAINEDESKSPPIRSASTLYEPYRPRERPKVAIRTGLRTNLPSLLPHLLAVAATLGVTSLSYRNTYWMDLVPPQRLIAPLLTQSGALNALQFAAKLHELLILASLTTIVMSAMRTHLLGQAGLPFGLIASGFQIFSGEWLRRKSFWASWKARNLSGSLFGRYPFVPFLTLFIVSSLLATLAGPSSAIAIVPSLNWFPLRQPFNTTVLPFFIFNQTSELWPATVTAANLNGANAPNNCTYPMDSATAEACPSGGFGDLYSWSLNLLFLEPQKGTNVSFQADRSDTRRVVTCKSCDGPGTGKASAMSLNSALTGALTTFWTYAGDNLGGQALQATQPKIAPTPDAEIFAPRVHVVCDTYSFDRSNTSDLTSMVFPKLGNDPPIDAKLMHVPKWTWDYSRPMNSSNFTWVPLPKTPGGPSIGAVFTIPLTVQDDYPTGPWHQSSELIVCSVYAQWAPVDAWYEPTTTDQVDYSIADSNVESCLDSPLSPVTTREAINITLDMGYANAINAPIDFVTGDEPALYGLIQPFISPSGVLPGATTFYSPYTATKNGTFAMDQTIQSRSMMLATVLATVTTDGLARIAGNGVWPYSTPIFVEEESPSNLTGIFPQTDQTGGFTEPLNTTAAHMKDWLRLDIEVQRFGYGYQWRDSKTVQFGISVLLVHVAMAVGHLFYMLWTIVVEQQGVGCSWDQITELIALAINSKSTSRMENTCAGIETSRTWQEIVAVRETYAGHLEMVFGEEAKAMNNLAEAEKKYG